MALLREWIHRLFGTLAAPTIAKPRWSRSFGSISNSPPTMRDGKSGAPDAAVRAAAIRAGGVGQAMEAMRDQRSLPWIGDARPRRAPCDAPPAPQSGICRHRGRLDCGRYRRQLRDLQPGRRADTSSASRSRSRRRS